MLLSAAGCSTVNKFRTDLSAPAPSISNKANPETEDAALINNLRSAFDACKQGACTGSKVKTDKDSPINEVLGAGLALSDVYCDRFFRASNASSRHRRFTRAVVNDVGGAMNVVLGLAKAGTAVSNGLAAGFSLGDGFFRNYDESYMVDADLSKVQRLVHAAQDNMKVRLEGQPPKNLFAAESAIIRYANLCSFLGMQNLLNDSVGDKTNVLEDETKQLIKDGAGAGGQAPAAPRAPAAPTPAAPAPAPAPAVTQANAPPPPPAGLPVEE